MQNAKQLDRTDHFITWAMPHRDCIADTIKHACCSFKKHFKEMSLDKLIISLSLSIQNDVTFGRLV